tara:strand:+ start:7 stop:942 length:936 start_codon:yes stop_codon:yes gene_type:complete
MIFAMLWMFIGAWVDASAHRYIIDELESFFTPWHGILYSGFGVVVLSALYVKNKMRDFNFDVGILGACIFAVGGGSDAIWHSLLGIEVGIEPLITPSHLMLFLGAFLMLDHVFASRPNKEILDTASLFALASSYALIVYITQFVNPFFEPYMFFQNNEFIYQAFSASSVFFQAILSSVVFVYAIRFNVLPRNMALIYLISFMYQSLIFLLGDSELLFGTLIAGGFISLLIYQISSWYYRTNHDRKIQISTALVGAIYGLTVVLYILFIATNGGYDLPWRFYGLGGLITTPLLFGYMVGNLGVSPTTGETVS